MSWGLAPADFLLEPESPSDIMLHWVASRAASCRANITVLCLQKFQCGLTRRDFSDFMLYLKDCCERNVHSCCLSRTQCGRIFLTLNTL